MHAGIAHRPPGFSTNVYLPLEEVEVDAWVVDVSSRIILTQTFRNPSNVPTGRAKYVFPLPANAAVCQFNLELEDGSVIIGEVKEKGEADLDFTNAVRQGKAAALIERVTDDIFTVSLGSIPPASRVVTHLTFVMDLLNEALRDHIRLQLPMHIAPRYGPPPVATVGASAADSRTRVKISVDVQTSDVIYNINSPTHRVKLRRYKGHSGKKSKRRMSVLWKSTQFLGGDFVITIHAEGLDKPRCFAEKFRGENGPTIAMQLTLIPKFIAPKLLSQEYIFIIDRSGSMQGASIETAKRSLDMLLRLLPTKQTTFNIFGFGSSVEYLWPSSRAFDLVSLREAISYVASIDANLGGTEIPSALQSAFNSRVLDRPTAVFLLTDGQINLNDRLSPWVVISNAIQSSPLHSPLRLFVLGIGNGVSSDVCSSLAQRGNGEYLFALSAEGILGKCARLFNAGHSRNIEQIDIDWGCDVLTIPTNTSTSSVPSPLLGITQLEPPPAVQQAPCALMNIFSGIRFTVFAIVSSETAPTSVRLTTKLDGNLDPLELLVDVTKVKPFRDAEEYPVIPMVHTLAARKLIMELDNGTGPLPTAIPGDALIVSQDDLRRAGIVRLGLAYQLASKHTSFVAVQGRDQRTVRGHRSMAWARSRLQQTDTDIQDSLTDVPSTFLDDVINGISSFVTSLFSLFSNPATLTSTTNTTFTSRSRHHPLFPGAYDESDSEMSDDRGRGLRRASGRRSPSRDSVDTFSSLSSLEGSSCSACWTSSRSPSPFSRSRDMIERAPSPEFLCDTERLTSAGVGHRTGHGGSNKKAPVPSEVVNLFNSMNIDGSFADASLIRQLVGDGVLEKAGELGINERVWTMVVSVAYISTRLEGEPELLDLIFEKAKGCVEASEWYTASARRPSFDEMIQTAVALFVRSGEL